MKKNSFMEGALIATAAIIFSKILGILYVIPFYRIIGTKGGALYGYAYNIYNTFLIISSAGIPLAISKITSEYEVKKETNKKVEMYKISQKIILIFSILSFLICFIFAKPISMLILGDLKGGNTISDVTFVIRCVSVALLIVPLLSIQRGYLQGHKYIGASSFSQCIEQIVRIAVILVGSYLALKVFGLPLKMAVGISVLAAGIGALIAYVYLLFKMRKVKDDNVKPVNKKEKKEIINKIIAYSIPFIVINIASNLYNTTDMILMVRCLKNLGYSAADVETISSIFTTWGNKLLSIVKAFATGLTISLIPSLVSCFLKKDQEGVNDYFNKTCQTLLLVITPITIFMSIFAKPIWEIFYSADALSASVFKVYIITGIFESAYILSCTTLQSIFKTKLVYISAITGLVINLILDVPLMILFDKFGCAYNGAIAASIIGFIISIIIVLRDLRVKEHISLMPTLKTIPKLVISMLILYGISKLYIHFMPVLKGTIGTLVYVGIIGIVYVGIFYILNYKSLNEMINLKFKKTKKEN